MLTMELVHIQWESLQLELGNSMSQLDLEFIRYGKIHLLFWMVMASAKTSIPSFYQKKALFISYFNDIVLTSVKMLFLL